MQHGNALHDGQPDTATFAVAFLKSNETLENAGTIFGRNSRAGVFDLLVEGPTLAWTSTPFAGKEMLSVRLGIELN